VILAHQVLDVIAAREFLVNFAKILGGVESNNTWHTKVVVGCKVEWFCKISKSAQSMIR
jgi:hypothetical protein